MLAAGCGLRHGEARAVRPMDIRDGILTVARQWDRHSGSFRPPKCGSVREGPIPPRVQAEIAAYVQERRIQPEGVLSGGQIPTRPVERCTALSSLRTALEGIGISRIEQKRRYLDLHALRHTYITRLRVGDVPVWQIMKAAGHKSIKMTDHYTHGKGEDLKAVAEANILPFAKGA
jgi:integrase